MNAKAWTKSLNTNVRWSLPSSIFQPGSVPSLRRTSSSASTPGRAIRVSSPGGRRRHDRRALDVLVADLAHVEGFEILGQLLEGLIEARKRLALPGKGRCPGEHVVLHVGMIDPALLDLGHDASQRLVRFPDQSGALLAILERLGEFPLQELVHAPKHRREGAAREALVLLVEETERHEVGGLELEGVILLAGVRLFRDEAAIHANDF